MRVQMMHFFLFSLHVETHERLSLFIGEMVPLIKSLKRVNKILSRSLNKLVNKCMSACTCYINWLTFWGEKVNLNKYSHFHVSSSSHSHIVLTKFVKKCRWRWSSSFRWTTRCIRQYTFFSFFYLYFNRSIFFLFSFQMSSRLSLYQYVAWWIVALVSSDRKTFKWHSHDRFDAFPRRRQKSHRYPSSMVPMNCKVTECKFSTFSFTRSHLIRHSSLVTGILSLSTNKLLL